MRYEVDVEEYGTISLESPVGNVLLQITGDGNSMTFDLSKKEFLQLRRAVNLVLTEIEIEMEKA